MIPKKNGQHHQRTRPSQNSKITIVFQLKCWMSAFNHKIIWKRFTFFFFFTNLCFALDAWHTETSDLYDISKTENFKYFWPVTDIMKMNEKFIIDFEFISSDFSRSQKFSNKFWCRTKLKHLEMEKKSFFFPV